MKTIDTRAYLDEVVSILKEGNKTFIPIKGMSMLPFLKEDRDYVFLEFFNEEVEPKTGDILLFIRWDGKYVLHRLHKIDSNALVMLGDNQVLTERINRNQVKARVVSVKRKGKLIDQESIRWKFFAGPWNRVLLLRKAVGWISRFKRRPNEIEKSVQDENR